MEQEQNRVKEQHIMEKIRRLDAHQIAQVIDFIEWLAERRQRQAPLVRFLSEMSGPLHGLEDVRRRLAKIPGKMSEAVRELRNDRG